MLSIKVGTADADVAEWGRRTATKTACESVSNLRGHRRGLQVR